MDARSYANDPTGVRYSKPRRAGKQLKGSLNPYCVASTVMLARSWGAVWLHCTPTTTTSVVGS